LRIKTAIEYADHDTIYYKKGKIMRIYFVSIALFIYINLTALKQEKKVILFDLMNVLIKENYNGFAKKIGYGNLASYALTHWKNPGHRCLDMLEEMSKQEIQKPHTEIVVNKRVMPRCLIELQEGKKTCIQVKDEINQAITLLDSRNHFSSPKEKKLLSDIMNLVLDPQSTASLIEPIKTTLTIVQKLKNAGHSVYLFANVPPELHTILQQQYAGILALFDGIVISADIQTVKPDRAIFEHFLQKYNVPAQQCILIDEGEKAVKVAHGMGMQAFVYNKNIGKQLKKYGIRI
jgi:FMN phosphatase YigB (HAD superfamily)